MTIRDQGRGFNFQGAEGHFGIANSITARLASVGGSAAIISAPGKGTRIELEVPN